MGAETFVDRDASRLSRFDKRSRGFEAFGDVPLLVCGPAMIDRQDDPAHARDGPVRDQVVGGVAKRDRDDVAGQEPRLEQMPGPPANPERQPAVGEDSPPFHNGGMVGLASGLVVEHGGKIHGGCSGPN